MRPHPYLSPLWRFVTTFISIFFVGFVSRADFSDTTRIPFSEKSPDQIFFPHNTLTFIDTTNTLTCDDVQRIGMFQFLEPGHKPNPNHTYWHYIPLKIQNVKRELMLLNPLLTQTFVVYEFANGNFIVKDSTSLLDTEEIRFTKADQYIVRTINSADVDLYIKIQPTSFYGTFFYILSTVERHIKSSKNSAIFLGFIFGMYLLVLLSLSIIFFSFREKPTLALGIYFGFFVIYFLVQNFRLIEISLLQLFGVNNHGYNMTYHIPFVLLVLSALNCIYIIANETMFKKLTYSFLTLVFTRMIYLTLTVFFPNLYHDTALDIGFLTVLTLPILLQSKFWKFYPHEAWMILFIFLYFILYAIDHYASKIYFISNLFQYKKYIFGFVSLLPFFAYLFLLKKKFKVIETQRDNAIQDYVVQLQLNNSNIEKLNKELDQKIKERTKELQERNERLDNLIYLVSHNIRGPISTVLGLCNISRMDEQPCAHSFYVDKIAEVISKMDHTYKDISKILLLDKYEAQKEYAGLQELINSVAESLEIDKQMINFNVEINAHNQVLTDPYLYKLILEKLLSNSIQFADPAKTYSEIYLTVTSIDNFLLTTVSDNGMGIQEAAMPYIFDIYYRGNERSKGQGLGLYIVKRSVELLEGKIEVESTLHLGTTFKIWLPI